MAGSLLDRVRFMAGLLLTVAKRGLPSRQPPLVDDTEDLIEAFITCDTEKLDVYGQSLAYGQNANGTPWFFIALECGGLQTIRWFLDQGANSSLPDPAGRLPLEAVIQRQALADEFDDHLGDCRAMAADLIAAGANPRARNLQGQSLTDLALAAGLTLAEA